MSHLHAMKSLHTSSALRADSHLATLLRRSIESVQAKKKLKLEETEQKRLSKQIHTNRTATKKGVLTADRLNDNYRSKFKEIRTHGALAEINGFFNSTEVRLEWTSAKFLDIPGERERLEREKKLEKQDVKDLDSAVDLPEIVSSKNITVSKSTGLPEIAFLGKANVGKSTLLNSLLTQASTKKASEFAFASKTAGFTQTMNCFNIGKRFRLIDTPGYGIRGTQEQGKQVLEYLRRRKELRRVYLLISAAEGFDQNDYSLIDFLTESGVPFEIVFTKVDRLKSEKTVEKVLKDSGILGLPSEPSLIFTNSSTNKRFSKRQGLTELRSSIFEVCDLKPGTHPLKLIKR